MLLLAAAVFRLMDWRWGEKRWFSLAAGGMLVLWIGAMAWATLLDRGEPGEYPVCLIPFHSYRELLAGGDEELLRSNFMNAVLFFPGGVLLGALLPGRWPVWKRMWPVWRFLPLSAPEWRASGRK